MSGGGRPAGRSVGQSVHLMAIKLTRVHCTNVRGDVIPYLVSVVSGCLVRRGILTSLLLDQGICKKPFISRKFSVTGACFAELRAVKTLWAQGKPHKVPAARVPAAPTEPACGHAVAWPGAQ